MADSKGARAMRHPIWDSHLAPRISTLENQKLYANLFDDEDAETANLIWSRSRNNGD